MADVLNYSTLFARLKVLIFYFNLLEARQTSSEATNYPLPYIKNQILVPYESQDITKELQTLETDFVNTILSLNSLKLNILTWFEAGLISIADSLGVHSQTPLTILLALADAMAKDSETLNARELIVNASDVEETSIIVPHGSNIGSGRLAYSFLRTGLSVSEIANEEVLQCNCLSVTTPKSEIFQLSGAQNNSRESYLGQGSGLGPTITALGNSITNGDFEDWTSSAADNWTATVGAWDTEIVQEASVLYEGTYTVKTAYAEGDWKITHAVPITILPDTTYIMVLSARKVTSATGTLRFGLSNGDGVSAFVSGCVKSIDVTDLTTSYALQFLIFKSPAAVSSAWTLGISSDTPGTADIYFDLAQFNVMTSFNNMNFAIVSGATGFGIDDKFGFGSDNTGFKIDISAPGTIQEFIGRCFNTQLPSATSGNETIADPVGEPFFTIFETDSLTVSDGETPLMPMLQVFVSDDLTAADSTTEYQPVYVVSISDDLTVETSETISVPVLEIFISDDLTVATGTIELQPVYEASVNDALTVDTSTAETVI